MKSGFLFRDVINRVTTPPVGGEEQRGIHGNVPEDKQTAETAPKPLPLVTGDEVELSFRWLVEERPSTNAAAPE